MKVAQSCMTKQSTPRPPSSFSAGKGRAFTRASKSTAMYWFASPWPEPFPHSTFPSRPASCCSSGEGDSQSSSRSRRQRKHQRLHNHAIILVSFAELLVRVIDQCHGLAQMLPSERSRRAGHLFRALPPHAHADLREKRLRLLRRIHFSFLGREGQAELRAQERQRQRQVFAFPHQNVERSQCPGPVPFAECVHQREDRALCRIWYKRSQIVHCYRPVSPDKERQLLDLRFQAVRVAGYRIQQRRQLSSC